MAGGLAGSVVCEYGLFSLQLCCFLCWDPGEANRPEQTVLVLKYVVPGYPFPTLYFGIANVVANGLIMIRFDAQIPLRGVGADPQ